MSMEALVKDFTADAKGFYEDVRNMNADLGLNVQPLEAFAAKARDEYGLAPEDREAMQREEHYLRAFKVAPFETRRDSRVREYARASWALEKVFADQRCPLHGVASPTVEKAFTTSSLQGLFPIFFDTMVVAGILASPVLQRVVAETVPTNSGIANHIELAETAGDRQVSEIGEGARSTQVNIVVRERQIALKKFGYQALASYEAVRRARLPVFARTLMRVGQQFQILLTDFAIDVLVLGDSTSPSNAATTVAAAVAGAPVYSDYVNINLGFTMGYVPDLWVAPKESIVKLLNVPEFKDPLAGFRYQNQGIYPMPFGIELVRWDSTGNSSGWPASAGNAKILVMDTSLGLIQYTEGGMITETDRIINAGWERVVGSMWVGFAIMDPASRIVGTGFA